MVSACFAQIDLGFIIDESTSISSSSPPGRPNWDLILSAIQAVIQTFPIGPTQTRVGMVKFATTASLTFTFDRYPTASSLIRVVSGLVLGSGETNYADAYRIANSQLFPGRRPGVKTIAIMMTDGVPNQEVDQTFININATKDSGVEIFAIGVGTQVSQS